MKRVSQIPVTLELWGQESSDGLIIPGKFVQQLPHPRLCSVTDEAWEEALTNIWQEIGPCLACYKADGWRMQIHKQGKEVNLFSRSNKRWTKEFIAVAHMIRERVDDDQAILDTEIVGFDKNDNHLQPSELLSKRFDHYRCYLLDALYLDGKDITSMPTFERHSFTKQHLLDQEAFCKSFTFADYVNVDSLEELINFYQQWQKGSKKGFDGVILKKLHTTYFGEILKLKPQDTVDAVVVGAYHDEPGKVSSLLLAVPSTLQKRWKPIAKVQKTGKDKAWEAIWQACQPFIQNHRPPNLEEPPTLPDIWFAPEIVTSVTITTMRASKGYHVLAEHPRSCVLREDKGAEEATSFEQVLAMANLPEKPLSTFDSHKLLQFALETSADMDIDPHDKDKESEAQKSEQEHSMEMQSSVLLETLISNQKIMPSPLFPEE